MPASLRLRLCLRLYLRPLPLRLYLPVRLCLRLRLRLCLCLSMTQLLHAKPEVLVSITVKIDCCDEPITHGNTRYQARLNCACCVYSAVFGSC